MIENNTILCKIAEQNKAHSQGDNDPGYFTRSGKSWKLLDHIENKQNFIKFIELCDWRTHSKFTFEEIEEEPILPKHQKRTLLVVVAKNIDSMIFHSIETELYTIIFKDYPHVLSMYELPICNENKIELNVNNDSYDGDDSDDNIDDIYNIEERPTITKPYITTSLYNTLYKEHQLQASLNGNQKELHLPSNFLPTLCKYQERCVHWLLQREQQTDCIPNFFKELHAKDGSTVVYINLFDGHVQQKQPPNIKLAPGGILADEMGLGKTVEVLALVLLNPRPKTNKNIFEDVAEMQLSPPPKKRASIDVTLFCTCTATHTNNIIQCQKCLKWQHAQCVTQYNAEHDDDINQPYLCPACWNELTQITLLDTGATLIVSPHTIKLQWLSEIQRHINPTLRVLIYNGIGSGFWISPRQLANYDVVLTDYNILRNEVYHTAENVSDRVTRNKPRSLRVNTPLMMLNWWRVCLDEAQMVESNTSKVGALVRMVPAVNRWAVTGTPIQRSIHDLQYLLLFIGLHEVCDSQQIWRGLVYDFIDHYHLSGQIRLKLVEVLQKCMWRTCKSKVIDELQIPPQKEIVHRIKLSNLEKLFYMEQHVECCTKFHATIDKYIQRADEISPHVMKLILQPLLKIRQCCTIPVVVGNKQNNVLMAQKQFLQPMELHSHLKSTNELECKAELRTMASSYNGVAGIYFLQEKYDDAITHYECVLKLAADYKDINITVDSLLQIHSLHNILQAIHSNPHYSKNLPTEKITKYIEDCNNLEWKYLESYASTLANVQSDLQQAKHTNEKLLAEINDINLIKVLAELGVIIEGDPTRLHNPLMNKIFEDCAPQFANNVKLHAVQSISGVLYVINIWWKKLEEALCDINEKFENLRFFTDNVRSRNQVNVAIWRNIKHFVGNVYECHLSEIRDTDKQGDKEKEFRKQKRKLCNLCVVRNVLNEFECLLFDKIIDKETNITEGLANPSMEINLIKVIFTFMKLKSRLNTRTRNLDKYWQSIENMQTICKKMIKFWIEIEYTVKAYDELDMCKMRISLTTDTKEKNNYKITEFEIDQTLMEQQVNLRDAQRRFTMKLARLKYIMHLEANADPGPCPICRSDDDTKYAVLECGHHICLMCLRKMRKLPNTHRFTCALCRNQQNAQKIYFVTRDQVENVLIQGNYSSKVTYMVRLLLKMKQEHDEMPKILIFSQWQEILNAVAAALKENSISYRLQWSTRTIEEFKDPNSGISCLLMPMSKGSKGLNLIEATHVFLVEPILNPGEELQAIGRVHRFGQTKPTTVHRFIVDNTIEENIYQVVATRKKSHSNWEFKNISTDDLRNLFKLENDVSEE